MIQSSTKEKVSALIIEKFITDYAETLLQGSFEKMMEEKDYAQLSVIYSQFYQSPGADASNPIECLTEYFKTHVS